MVLRDLWVPTPETPLTTPFLAHEHYKAELRKLVIGMVSKCKEGALPYTSHFGKLVEARWRTIEDQLFNLKAFTKDLDFDALPGCTCWKSSLPKHSVAMHVAATGAEMVEMLDWHSTQELFLLSNTNEPLFPSYQAYMSRLMGDLLAYFRANKISLGPSSPCPLSLSLPLPLPVLCLVPCDCVGLLALCGGRLPLWFV